jgi:hypothetical protein
MLLTQLQTFKKHKHEIELLEMRCLAVGADGNGLHVLRKDKQFEKGFIAK